MPRPPRCRRICDAPQVDTFCPNGCGDSEPILLTLDEYEVIRLVDLEQQTHEQCAVQMDISRSTVQEIYESARRKIAACLVHGSRCTSPEEIIAFAVGRRQPIAAVSAGCTTAWTLRFAEASAAVHRQHSPKQVSSSTAVSAGTLTLR